jgi:putative transposase
VRKSRFTDEQILSILKQRDAGRSISELCAENGISEATLYAWRTKYRLHSPVRDEYMEKLRAENQRLRDLVFDLTLERETLKGELRRTQWIAKDPGWSGRRASSAS